MIDSYWTGIYRVLDYDLLDQTRPIMTVVANINIALSPGTYWLDWSIEGILTSGPWVPPITILGQTTTGTGLQHLSSGWGPAVDIATSAQQGLPFVIEGALISLLWEQPLSDINQYVVISHEFPDLQTHSSFLADDFVVDGTWEIDTIFFPGNGWNGFTSLLNATALHWEIYADDNGFPAGDPSGGGDPPIWSLTLPVTDLSIYISTGYDGLLSDTFLTLPTPVKLTSGHYWIVFYPTLNRYPYGQFGLHQADTTNGGLAKFINAGNGFGIGSSWQNWDVIFGVTNDDLAFTIGGISYYELFLPLTNK